MQKDDESYLVYDYIRRNGSKKIAKAFLADIGLKSPLAKARLRILDITLESIFNKAGDAPAQDNTPEGDAQTQLPVVADEKSSFKRVNSMLDSKANHTESIEGVREKMVDTNPSADESTFERPKGTGKRFSRIDVQRVEFAHPSLKDNQFKQNKDSFGAKANHDLLITRGKGFRVEKTKKKKGSYRGGNITTQVSSYKFE